MRRICVFCGSNPGARPDYAIGAEALGTLLAEKGIGLVYGGSGKGLMGTLADAVLAGGGHVTGVITHHLADMGAAHHNLSDLVKVETMHERKATMASLSDGFIAMPGGIGTLEELFEALTWSQLGIHTKACGLFNIAGYYDRLVAFLGDMTREKFLKGNISDMLAVEHTPDALLSAMKSLKGASGQKWFAPEEATA
jgi:uncharacterized protein (TIGR00730 family)